MTWEERKPIYGRLPDAHKTDAALALTQGMDAYFISVKEKAEDFYLNTIPLEAPVTSLDWLAYCIGLDTILYDKNWDVVQKRAVLHNAFFIYRNRGTAACLELVSNILELNYTIGLSQSTLLPFTIPKIIQGTNKQLIFKMEKYEKRDSVNWLNTVYVAKALVPIFQRYVVSYDNFYLGKSRLGEIL